MKKRILVVDSDPVWLEKTLDALSGHGYELLGAKSYVMRDLKPFLAGVDLVVISAADGADDDLRLLSLALGRKHPHIVWLATPSWRAVRFYMSHAYDVLDRNGDESLADSVAEVFQILEK